MGTLFNSAMLTLNRPSVAADLVEEGVAAALKLMDTLPWEQREGDTNIYFWEGSGYAGIKIEIQVEFPAFALAMLFRSVEFKKQDPNVQHAEIIQSLGEN